MMYQAVIWHEIDRLKFFRSEFTVKCQPEHLGRPLAMSQDSQVEVSAF